jgi:hypothetical protein
MMPERMRVEGVTWLFSVLGVVLAVVVAVQAGLTRIARSDQVRSSSEFTAADAQLAQAVAYIKAEGAAGKGESLAVHLTPAGHWQLANVNGEVITAAGAEEARRAIATLRPAVSSASAEAPAPALVLTAEAAGRASTNLGHLPASSSLTLLAAGQRFRLHRQTGGDGKGWLLAEARSHLLIELSNSSAIWEMLWQLDRKLEPSAVRLLSLEPGGPRTLPAVPKREAATRTPLPDAIDPYGLVKALPALRGQKVLVVGRLDKELLWYQPRTGAEQSVLVKDLREAASASDIALVILDTRLARQPGERTWAYLKVGVPGFDEAMKATTVADFYNALATAQGKFVLRVIGQEVDRTRIEAVPFKTAQTARGGGQGAGERGVGGILQDVVSGLTGSVVPAAVHMDLRSRDRQIELDRRWLPGIPSMVQITYAVLMAIGLAAWPLARRWWARIWPAEERVDYGSMAGYGAARAIRGIIFALAFVPAIAVVSFPAQVMLGLGETAGLLLRGGRAKRREPVTPA